VFTVSCYFFSPCFFLFVGFFCLLFCFFIYNDKNEKGQKGGYLPFLDFFWWSSGGGISFLFILSERGENAGEGPFCFPLKKRFFSDIKIISLMS